VPLLDAKQHWLAVHDRAIGVQNPDKIVMANVRSSHPALALIIEIA
jgi:hypothetical protein